MSAGVTSGRLSPAHDKRVLHTRGARKHARGTLTADKAERENLESVLACEAVEKAAREGSRRPHLCAHDSRHDVTNLQYQTLSTAIHGRS